MKQSTPPPVITSGRTPTAPSRLKRLREDSSGEQSGVSSATEPDSSGAEKSIPDQVALYQKNVHKQIPISFKAINIDLYYNIDPWLKQNHCTAF